jgi:hypothetical protein
MWQTEQWNNKATKLDNKNQINTILKRTSHLCIISILV